MEKEKAMKVQEAAKDLLGVKEPLGPCVERFESRKLCRFEGLRIRRMQRFLDRSILHEKLETDSKR